MLKIIVLTPIAKASVPTTTAVKVGVLVSPRSASRIGVMTERCHESETDPRGRRFRPLAVFCVCPSWAGRETGG